VTKYDYAMAALAIIGLALTILLGLLSEEWRAMHRKLVSAGRALGLVLLGIGAYMLALVVIPPEWGLTMWPKISIVVGTVLLAGGLIWQFASPSGAQVMPNNSDPNHITGMKIEGNSQGGAAAEIIGGAGANPAADINVTAGPGQSATGLHVIQTGPGTGLRVIQNGPGTGLRVGVTVGKPKD
jgi:hypothetical protein